jgi:hypothetical protein
MTRDLQHALDCAAHYLAEAKKLAARENRPSAMLKHLAVAECRTAAAVGELNPTTPPRFAGRPQTGSQGPFGDGAPKNGPRRTMQ